MKSKKDKPRILFHGSRKEIKDFLEPQKATDKTSSSNSQNGVYATDRFECAAGMSLTGDPWAFANYQDKNFKVIFVEQAPTPKIERFVYEIESDTFEESPIGSHQWISHEKVKIVKTYIYLTEDLNQYWRMATKKEREQRYNYHKNR